MEKSKEQQLNDKTKQKEKKILFKVDEKKQKELDEMWKKVNQFPELNQLIQLKHKIDKSQESRMQTSEQVNLVKIEYDKVKSQVQNFIKDQNMTSHKMSVPKRKKTKKSNDY